MYDFTDDIIPTKQLKEHNLPAKIGPLLNHIPYSMEIACIPLLFHQFHGAQFFRFVRASLMGFAPC